MKLVKTSQLIHGEHYFIEKVSKMRHKVIWKARGDYSSDSSLYKEVQSRRQANEVFAFTSPQVYIVNEYSKEDVFEWIKELLPSVFIYNYNDLLDNDDFGYYYRFYHSEKEAIIKNSLTRNMSIAMKHTLSRFVTDIHAVDVITNDFFPVVSYDVSEVAQSAV